MPAGYIFCWRFFFLFLVVDLGASSSQKLLDGSLPTFQGLVELCKGLINFPFVWLSLKGRCHGNQRNLKNRFFRGKMFFFVTLPFQNGLEYRNTNGQVKSALNVATSCANTVMIGRVTPKKPLLIVLLLWKKCKKWAYPAYYIRICSTNVNHIFIFDRHVNEDD